MKALSLCLLVALLAGPAFATSHLEAETAAPSAEGGSVEVTTMPSEAGTAAPSAEGGSVEPATTPSEVAPEEPVPPDVVARAALTTDVVDREPVDQIVKLTADHDRIFFFTEIIGMEGRSISHRWEYGGEVLAEVSFEIRGPRWRVFSSKALLPTWLGGWTVSVLDASGNQLVSRRFEYVAAAPSAPEEEAPMPSEPAAPAVEPAAPEEPSKSFRPSGAPGSSTP